MNKVVFGNLGLLDVYLNNHVLISEGNELALIGKEEYETIEKITSLEYPIYYTYHELLTMISCNNDLSYSSKIYYLEKIIETLDILIQYIDDYKDEDSRICYIIDGIYERYETVKSQTVYKWGEKIVFLFDDLVDGFRNASKYLYFAPPLYPLLNLKMNEFLEDEGECDSEEEYTSNSENESAEYDNESIKESDDESGKEEKESDDEPDSESGEEKELIKIDFEGVEYLEDESTNEIYNSSQQLVGEWNENGDDIIWKSNKFKKTHKLNRSTLNELD